MILEDTFRQLVEYGCRAIPKVCDCATHRPDPTCRMCEGNGEHICLCVGVPLPADMEDGCPICDGRDIARCAACMTIPRPDPACVKCRGTGARRSEPLDSGVAAVVASGLMEILIDLRRREAFHLYDEVLDMFSAYSDKVREHELATNPEAALEAAHVARDIICGHIDERDYRSPSSSPPPGRLSPHEQFELLGEAPEGSVLCRSCGEYTLGFFVPGAHGPSDWIHEGRVACCPKEACLAAWDDACAASQPFGIVTR